MADEGVLQITDDVWVLRSELTYRATRSGGPGGQHVNTSSTRVELAWDVAGTPSLSEEQRARVLGRLANRINSEGVLLLTDAGGRSQHQNKEAVTERFQALLRQALHVPKPRKKTRAPRASREARLRAKRHRSEIKRMRGSVDAPE
jgi:ribosome-associated protein